MKQFIDKSNTVCKAKMDNFQQNIRKQCLQLLQTSLLATDNVFVKTEYRNSMQYSFDWLLLISTRRGRMTSIQEIQSFSCTLLNEKCIYRSLKLYLPNSFQG